MLNNTMIQSYIHYCEKLKEFLPLDILYGNKRSETRYDFIIAKDFLTSKQREQINVILDDIFTHQIDPETNLARFNIIVIEEKYIKQSKRSFIELFIENMLEKDSYDCLPLIDLYTITDEINLNFETTAKWQNDTSNLINKVLQIPECLYENLEMPLNPIVPSEPVELGVEYAHAA